MFSLARLSQVNTMEQHECHALLMLDEIQLTPGLACDPSNDRVIGKPTIPMADRSGPKNAGATHAPAFMLGGVTTRWKQTVAHECTGNPFSESHAFHSDSVESMKVSTSRLNNALSLFFDKDEAKVLCSRLCLGQNERTCYVQSSAGRKHFCQQKGNNYGAQCCAVCLGP